MIDVNRFSFADYLNLLDSSKSDLGKKEAIDIRNHNANISSMSKHYRNYKALKLLIETYKIDFS